MRQRSFVHPIILLLVLVPMGIALASWAGITWVYWDTWTSAVQDFIQVNLAFAWAADWQTGRLVSWIAAGFVLLMLAPLMPLTALLIAALRYASPGSPCWARAVPNVATAPWRDSGRKSLECFRRPFAIRVAVGRDTALMLGRAIGRVAAGVALGFRKPEIVSLRRAIGACRRG